MCSSECSLVSVNFNAYFGTGFTSSPFKFGAPIYYAVSGTYLTRSSRVGPLVPIVGGFASFSLLPRGLRTFFNVVSFPFSSLCLVVCVPWCGVCLVLCVTVLVCHPIACMPKCCRSCRAPLLPQRSSDDCNHCRRGPYHVRCRGTRE